MSNEKKIEIKNSGYSEHGASRRKPSLVKWMTSTKSPHEDISENLELLRERSRDLYAGGGPLGRGAIDRVVLNAIGSGLKLNMRIDPALLGMTEEQGTSYCADIEGKFDYWASNRMCDVSRELTFYDMQVLALKSILLDGECFALLTHNYKNFPTSTAVQLIEPERIVTPPNISGVMIDEGIELDENGDPCAIWVTNRNPNSELMNQPLLEYKRFEIFSSPYSARRNILHLFQRERIGQHRGVPFLSPVIEQLKQLSRYTDAELTAAVVSGLFAIFFEHEPIDDGDYGEESYASDEGLGEVPGLENISQQELAGTVIDLPPGVKATGVSSGRPNQNFNNFVQQIVEQIGSTLGIPSELMFLHFTASYSASRGALLEAWKMFKYWRAWFAREFCQPVFEEWFDTACSVHEIEIPEYKNDYERSLYTWAEWVGPSQGQLDPTKEVQAAMTKISNNLSTYQRECSELTGEDWDLVLATLARERAKVKGAWQG